MDDILHHYDVEMMFTTENMHLKQHAEASVVAFKRSFFLLINTW